MHYNSVLSENIEEAIGVKQTTDKSWRTRLHHSEEAGLLLLSSLYLFLSGWGLMFGFWLKEPLTRFHLFF